MLQQTGRSDRNGTRVLSVPECEIAYSCILRAILDRSIVDEKRRLVKEMGCSFSCLDGVHAQITKDLKSACARDTSWSFLGDPVLQLRAALRYEPDTFDARRPELLKVFSALVEARGAGIAWRQVCPDVETAAQKQTPPRRYRGAAHADYDFPAKQRWRLEWERFLERKLADMSQIERAKLRVVCLPSKDPRREISLYLRLGIAPQNIFAVEQNKDAAAELRCNLRKLGPPYSAISLVEKSLEVFFRDSKASFDIVSLDFHGCYGVDKNRICAFVPLSPKAYVLVNLLCGREKEKAKHLMSKMRTMAAIQGGRHSAGCNLDPFRAREGEIEYSFLSSMGYGNPAGNETWGPRLQRLHSVLEAARNRQKRSFIENLELVHDSIEMQADNISDLLGDSPRFGRFIDRRGTRDLIAVLMLRAVFCDPIIKDVARFEYTSQTSTTHQTYYSSFAEISRSAENYSRWKRSVNLLWHAVQKNLEMVVSLSEHEALVSRWELHPLRKSSVGFRLVYAYRSVQESEFRRLDGTSLDPISLLADLDSFTRWYSNLPFVTFASFAAVPRSRINDQGEIES